MRRRLRQLVQQIIDVARYARRASPAYRVGAIALFARTVPICLRHQFSGTEVYRLGLFDPATQTADLSHYCSRRRITKIQRSLNPPPLAPLLRKHPNTGLDIEGFHLPLWDQACTLVRQAAVRFLPIKTIGWDVAMTPSGPMIVEANIWWDPPNQHRNLHTILQTIRDLCPSLA